MNVPTLSFSEAELAHIIATARDEGREEGRLAGRAEVVARERAEERAQTWHRAASFVRNFDQNQDGWSRTFDRETCRALAQGLDRAGDSAQERALADPDPAQATHDGEERVLKKVPRRPRGDSRPHRAGPST